MEKLKEGTSFEMIPHTAILDSRLSSKALHLLMVLWVKTRSDTGSCHYSTDTLCKLCGFSSKQTLQNAQKELVGAGWLEVKRGGVYGGRKQTNTYTILPNNTVEEEVRRDYGIEKKAESHKTIKAEGKDTTEKPQEQPAPYRKKFQQRTEPDSSGKYSDKRKSYFKTLKSYAESLDISEAWRDEILGWVNRVLDSQPEVVDTTTPKDLFLMGTKKFAGSDLR